MSPNTTGGLTLTRCLIKGQPETRENKVGVQGVEEGAQREWQEERIADRGKEKPSP